MLKKTFMNIVYLMVTLLSGIVSAFLILGALLDNLFHIGKNDDEDEDLYFDSYVD